MSMVRLNEGRDIRTTGPARCPGADDGAADGDRALLVLQIIVAGIAQGCVYGLIALGFVLIYKATETVNFAQGDLTVMKQERLVAAAPKRRRYGSYLGEISPASENLVNRDFTAGLPTRNGSPTSRSSTFRQAMCICRL